MSLLNGQLRLFTAPVDPLFDPNNPCSDCATPTTPVNESGYRPNGEWEWYSVDDDVWQEAGLERGYLCIGCLEVRIGRRLTPRDFRICPVNGPSTLDSPRLTSRRGRGRGTESWATLGS